MTPAVDLVPPAPPTPLTTELLDRLATEGAMRFDDYMEVVLYDPRRGFYATGGRAGARAGDFITSPEVGPLFGTVLAGVVDNWWRAAGSPPAFTVVEGGAGPGTLAAAIRSAQPACADALRWVMVERTAPQRVRHVERLGAREGRGQPLPAAIGGYGGPELISVARVPEDLQCDAVVANELCDNLPVRVLERTSGGWAEVWVASGGTPLRLVEQLRPLDPGDPAARTATRLAPDAAPGERVPIEQQAVDWLAGALRMVGPGGHVLVVDYADTTASMARRGQASWMRTYSAHGRGVGPLEACGAQDLTVDVALDQLAVVCPPSLTTDQASFLVGQGIGELVEEGRRVWAERAHVGDLAAVRARSRVREAEALCDPEGLGAHRVLGWGPALQQ